MRTRFVNLRIPNVGNETERAEILVMDGLVEEVLEAGSQTAVGEEHWVDLENGLVLPGLIDSNISLADPGYPLRGDFSNGTEAAATGGVTCVVDLPHTSDPPVTDINRLETKARLASAKAHVDFMLWGGVSGNSWLDGDWRKDVYDMADSGIAAIYLTMCSDLADFRELDFEKMAEVVQEAWRLGMPVGLHAETPEPIRNAIREARKLGDNEPDAWSRCHPAETEYSAIAVAREMCRAIRAQVHILGMSSGDSADMVREGVQEGLGLSAGTCPHYLEFTSEDMEAEGPRFKFRPALKEQVDRLRLWEGLRTGEISVVGSGHAAVQWPEEKHTESVWTDRAGAPTVEFLLPYLYSEGVCTGRISLEKLVELSSLNPARLFGIEHLKGSLTPGLHADFVVFDDNYSWTVQDSAVHGMNRFSPFVGRKVTGGVRSTYLRGQCVYRRTPDGQEMFGPAGVGQWIRRGQEL